jgi:SAM-dependent methyltransferase
VRSKPFLRAIYDEWYSTIAAQLPMVEGAVLELGSGAGHCAEFIPGLITSEIFFCPSVRLVANAEALPFANSSLRAIVFTDVLHHIPDARRFFSEACRCLRPGGKILMIEPWVSSWSRFVYLRLHHEPFLPHAKEWAFPSNGPLSAANGALPWIVFERDRAEFETEFPSLAIAQIRRFMPFRYLVSGGVSLRNLMPTFTYRLWLRLENAMEGLMPRLAMFAAITLERR